MTFKNPLTLFALTDHNEYRWPRAAFLLVHVLVGASARSLTIAIAAIAWHVRAHTPWGSAFELALYDRRAILVSLVMALAFAYIVKCIWFDWKRKSGTFWHWRAFGSHDPWDVLSDAVLGQIGCALLPLFVPWWALSSAFVVDSTFNGT